MFRHALARSTRFSRLNASAIASAPKLTSASRWEKTTVACQNACKELTSRSLPAGQARARSGHPSGRSPASLILRAEEVAQGRVAALQLAQRPRLDLPHALARDADLEADLLQRRRLALVQAEPGLEHVARALVELAQRFGEQLLALGPGQLGVG